MSHSHSYQQNRYSNTRNQGTAAEGVAAQYLTDHGYQVVQKNVFTQYGEIDLIAKKGSVYICVEVRSRSHNRNLSPELSLSYSKYIHWIRSVLSISWLHNKAVRLDFITVIGDRVVHHYKDVRIEQIHSRHKLAYAV